MKRGISVGVFRRATGVLILFCVLTTPIPTSATNGFFESWLCGFFGLLGSPCEEESVELPSTDVVEEQSVTETSPTKEPILTSSLPKTATSTNITYITNEYITNPVIQEILRETVRSGGSGSSIDISNFVTRELFNTQIKATYNSISNSFKGLSESLRTSLLTVTGDTSLSSLSVSGAFTDAFSSGGSYGDILSSTGTTTKWITLAGLASSTNYFSKSGSDIFYTGGNVGIGTATPTAELSVVGSILSTNSIIGNEVYQNLLQVASARLSYRDLLFYDDFNREDTAVGELGTSTSGHIYDMRGTSAQVGNAVTRIENSRWVSNPDDTTYAIQTLPTNVTRMGGRVSWVEGNGGADPGVFAMLISPDKTGSNLYLNAGAHILISRDHATIQYINNGTFVTVKIVTFPSDLLDDGTSYPFEITLNGPVMYYSFAGMSGSASSPFFESNSGVYATWEHFYDSASVSDLVRVEAIWAGTAPISAGALHDLGTSGLVGIGTSTPNANLEIVGTPSDTITSRNFLRFSSSVGSFIQQGLDASGDFTIDNLFGTATNLMTIKRNGLVGIGTTTPQRTLHVVGSGNQLRLSNSVNGTTYTEFSDLSPGTFSLSKTVLSGNATISLDPIVSDGTSATIVRLFRSTNTTGQSQFQIFKGDGTSNINTLFSSTGNSYINTLSDNVGIGTTTPAYKLTVAGTIGFSGLTTATGAGSVCLTTAGEVVYNAGSDSCLPSVRELKHDIDTLAFGSSTEAMIQSLTPVSFIYNYDNSNRTRYGFIADEVVLTDEHLATYNGNGELSGLDNNGFLALIISSLQELWQKVTGNTEKINSLEERIEKLEAELDIEPANSDIQGAGQKIIPASNAAASSTATSTQPASDTIPPVINVIGSDITFDVGDTYVDQGASAEDETDGDITASIQIDNPVATTVAGTYIVTYTVVDAAGNETKATRIVTVESLVVEQNASSTEAQ